MLNFSYFFTFQIRYIVETQNLPPREMLKRGSKSGRFFVMDTFTYEYRLKSADQYYREYGIKSKEARKYVLSSLDQIRTVNIFY